MKDHTPVRLTWAEVLLWVAVAAMAIVNLSGCRCDVPALAGIDCPHGTSRECYPGDPNHAGNGDCTMGVQTCTPDGWGECLGAGVPTDEVCDLRDNDCDGRTDDIPSRTIPCGTDEGACKSGWLQCSGGVDECFSEIPPKPEACNGVDDDCDGETDEAIPQVPCYTGPAGTDENFPCHKGVRVCTPWGPECLGQQLPDHGANECSTLVDSNCDGEVDLGNGGQGLDVAILIDRSGSMYYASAPAIDGVSSFVRRAAESQATVRVAIIGVDAQGKACHLATEGLEPAAQLAGRITRAIGGITGSGREETLDCTVGVVTPGSGVSLGWDPSANLAIVLITDEQCSSSWCLGLCPSGHWCRSLVSGSHRLTAQGARDMIPPEFETHVMTDPRNVEYYAPLGAEPFPDAGPKFAARLEQLLMEAVCR